MRVGWRDPGGVELQHGRTPSPGHKALTFEVPPRPEVYQASCPSGPPFGFVLSGACVVMWPLSEESSVVGSSFLGDHRGLASWLATEVALALGLALRRVGGTHRELSVSEVHKKSTWENVGTLVGDHSTGSCGGRAPPVTTRALLVQVLRAWLRFQLRVSHWHSCCQRLS